MAEGTEAGPGAEPAGLFAAADPEVARNMDAVDWAATPLGPPAGWPPSLRTAVGILLSLTKELTP